MYSYDWEFNDFKESDEFSLLKNKVKVLFSFQLFHCFLNKYLD